MEAALTISSPSENWSITVQRGRLVSVCGPRNSLAEHLLSAIAMRKLSTNGKAPIEVTVEGRPLSTLPDETYLNLISYLPDDPDVFFANMYVDEEIGFFLENICTPTSEIESRVAETAQSLGLSRLLKRKISSLSGGQKQLVAIAATLVANSNILLLDDPLANLDPENRQTVLRTLKQYCSRGTTIILAALDWTEWTPECDQLIVFNGTQVTYEGEPSTRAVAASNDVQSRPSGFVVNASWKASVQDRTPVRPRTVVVEDLMFGYEDQPHIITHGKITFELENVVGIVGRNGAGKTTFAKLLAGLLRPSAGVIKFKNFAMNDVGVAYAFQQPEIQFLADTAKDEIEFPFLFSSRSSSNASRDAIPDIVKNFDLSEVLDRHPLRISPLHQRRLILAALMATSPSMLILDEPTNGLDSSEKLIVQQDIRRIHATGTAVLIITHDRQTLHSIAKNALLIENGAISYITEI